MITENKKRKNQAIVMRATILKFLFPIGVLLVISFFTNHTLGWAADLTYQVLKTKKPQKVELVAGTSVVIEVPIAIKRASIANTEVADTRVLSNKHVYVIGKTIGVTNLTLWDKKNGRVFAVLDLNVRPDVSRLKAHLHKVLPGEKNVSVSAAHDSLTIWGTVSGPVIVQQVLDIAEPYAPKKIVNLLTVGGVQQVMLEVRIAEMSRELSKRLGFNWTSLNSAGDGIFVNKLNNLAQIVPSDAAVISPLVPGNISPFGLALNQAVNVVLRFQTGSITTTGFIDALKQSGLVKILAEPTLVALNGQEASFLAGGEFPFPVPQNFNTTTIKFKKFGVGLSFRPTILGNNRISIEVAPEVSELDFQNAITIQGFTIPSITTRRVKTVVELKDGQSFAIGGLIRENVREQISKFPLLGDIPILGALFRSSSFLKSETELVIIVTVHIIKSLDVVKQTVPTDFFVEPSDYEFFIEGKMEGPRQSRDGKASVTSLRKPSTKRTTTVGLDGEFGHIWP